MWNSQTGQWAQILLRQNLKFIFPHGCRVLKAMSSRIASAKKAFLMNAILNFVLEVVRRKGTVGAIIKLRRSRLLPPPHHVQRPSYLAWPFFGQRTAITNVTGHRGEQKFSPVLAPSLSVGFVRFKDVFFLGFKGALWSWFIFPWINVFLIFHVQCVSWGLVLPCHTLEAALTRLDHAFLTVLLRYL